jgi:hypothetical protein
LRIIIDAEPEEFDYVLGLIKEALPTFARHEERIGWGWTFGRSPARAFFISRTKTGFSARPAREPGAHLKAS